MVMRLTLATALAFTVTACGSSSQQDDPHSLEEATAEARADAADDGLIDCAIGGEAGFTRACTVDRITDKDGLLLTIRHKEGGFRRFRVLKDGRGVVPADGAEPALVTPKGNRAIEVQVGTDRYILPATVKGAAAPAQ
jgi:hypothetical protein